MRRSLLVLSFVVVAGGLASVVHWLMPEPVDAFLERHWQHPVPAQGAPPAQFSALEASLSPSDCGQCHAEQYADWSQSLHSDTMGPGIRWQLRLMSADQGLQCLRCHAPLTEQFALLAQERGWAESDAPRPAFVPADLHDHGLVCAACHVRGHERFGPPAGPDAPAGEAHGGFTAHAAFEDSRFCAECHQFAEDGPRLAGKLREDTYNQWRASRFAAAERHCQDCHMPDRRHVWKGIHDPAMTRRALAVDIRVDGEQVRARVTNAGAGHHFPTYLVPEVVLHLEAVDEAGGVHGLAQRIVAWRADVDLQEEIFDRRLAAGESIELAAPRFDGPLSEYRVRVSVAPRRHYVRTFEDYLQRRGDRLDPMTRQLLTAAIAEARATAFNFVASHHRPAPIAN